MMNCQRAHTPHKFQVRPKASLKTSTWDSRSHLLLLLKGLPWWLRQKESTCNAGDLGSIPELGRSPAEGNGDPLQYSCLENHHKQMGYSCEESDMTEQLGTAQHRRNY